MMKDKNKFLSILFIFSCIFATLFFMGCKKDSIKFYRESKVQQITESLGINKENNSKPRVIQSSSMLIYRYEDDSSKQKSTIHFGPSDLDFDIHK